VEYVGHPLIAKIRDYAYKPLSFPTEKKILALFPGSRKKEIERNLPLQLQVARKLSDFHIALSLSDERFAPLIHSIISQAEGEQISLIPADYTYELMRAAHAAIAKSGTVTLELALHETPTAVTYGIGALDLFIAKDLLRIRLPYYCLVNIIAQDEVFTEFIGSHFTEENLLAHMHSLLLPSHYARCQEHCQHVRALLGDKDASREAAYQLQHFLSP
jgi:lipid-A-disaccharide synthase